MSLDGNTVAKKNGSGAVIQSYNWDSKGRVQSIGSNSFAYDPYDYRIAKSDSSGSRSYLLEGEHLEAVMNGANWQAKYLRGAVIDEVVNGYQLNASNLWTNYTFHHDSLQSVLGLTGHEGSVLQAMQYGPFGEVIGTAGASNNMLRYTGRELDTDSGLYYYRARFYDPSIGRFISEDSKGFAAGVNFYAYVLNNPINANDPTGTIDVMYSAGSIKPSYQNTPALGLNYYVKGPQGESYPMGAGVYQRTVVGNRPFSMVIDAPTTSDIIDWGRTHILTNRLNGATGNTSLWEVLKQSGEGKPWDTKQFLPYQAVYIINGKAEQRDYVGNAIWGSGLNTLGISEITALGGAQAQSIMAHGTLDDPRDQEAISFGYSLPLPSFRGAGATGSWDSSASGGFVIYPNKPNLNMMEWVYSK